MRKIIIILVFIYSLLAAIYVTYPLVFHFTDSILGLGDELLINWIINWDIYAFTHFPLSIFNANIYYPYHNSLSFSDAFFTSAVIAFIPVKLFGEPAVAHNINILFTFTTLCFFTYLLVYYLTKNNFASIIAGTLFAFSTYTLEKTVHLQLLSIQWIPLCIYFYLKYLRGKKIHNFLFTCIFFIAQVYNSFLPGYFIIFSLLVISIISYFKSPESFKAIINRKVFIIMILTGLSMIPVILPYLKTSSEFHYVRDIRESIHTANRPEYFFYSYGKTRLKELMVTVFYKNNKGPYFYDGYLGFAFTVLSFSAIFYRIIARKKLINSYFDSFMFIGIFSFILSLGPAFQWAGRVIKDPFIIPLPYAVFYYILPGFKGFRNSGRWEMLMVFAFSIMIGLFFAKLYKNKSLLTKAIITFIICFIILAEFTFPNSIKKIPTLSEFPSAYSYISKLPPKAPIIELPIYNWNMQPYSNIELKREYYSTLHFHPMVNGGSGFSPPGWQENTFIFMLEFPNKKTIGWLRDAGVRYLLIHKDEYDQMERDEYVLNNKPVVNWSYIQKNINKFPDLKLIKQFGNDYLYELISTR